MSLSAQLTHLEAAGLLQPLSLSPELTYFFRHALIREAAYVSLLKAQRRALHQLVGETLESLSPDQLPQLSGLLARHFVEAQQPERALPHLLQAGENALAGFACEEALAYLQQAAALAEAQNLPSALRRALLGQGQVRYWRGENAPALACYEGALAFSTTPVEQGDLYNKIADTYHSHMGELETALIHYQKALALLQSAPDSVEMARLQLNLGYFYAVSPGTQKAVGLPHLHEAARLLTHHRQIQELAFCLSFFCFAYRPTEPDRAFRYGQEALRLAERHQLTAPLETAHLALGAIARAQGDWAATLQHYEAARAANARTGYVMGAGHENLQVAWAYLATRDFAAAAQAAQRAAQVWRQLNQPNFLNTSYALLSVALMLTAQPAAATAAQAAAEAAWPHPARTRQYRGYAYALAGCPAEALAEFRQARPHLTDTERHWLLRDPDLVSLQVLQEFQNLMLAD
jgi:tetratricopeptide (TPR) repeat protein